MGARQADTGPDLLLAHAGAVRGLAYALLGDEHAADDVLQDTFLRALVAPPPKRERIGGWLRRVAEGFALQRRRSEGRRVERERRYALERPEPPADPRARGEVLREVVDAVLSLPEPYEETILLRYFEGLPPREIARRQHVSLATVSSRLQRAHALLRERLDRSLGSRDGARMALLALLGLHSPRTVAVGSSPALGTGGLLMSLKTPFVVASVTVVAALAFVVRDRVKADSTGPVAPTSSIAAAPSSETASLSVVGDPTTSESRQAVASDSTNASATANASSVAAGPYEFDLEIVPIDESGRPLAAADVLAGPTLRRMNRLGSTEWDGHFRQHWRGFEPSLELVVKASRDGFGASRMRRVSLLAGAPTVVTLGLENDKGIWRAVEFAAEPAVDPSLGDANAGVRPRVYGRIAEESFPQFTLDEAGNGVFVDPWLLTASSWRRLLLDLEPTVKDATGSLIELSDMTVGYAVGGGRSGRSTEPPVRMTGVIRDARGAILPHVPVSLRMEWGMFGSDTTTDAEGRYEFQISGPHESPALLIAGDAVHGFVSERLTLRGGEPLVRDYTLEETRTMLLRLVDGEDRPLAGWIVEAYADPIGATFVGRRTSDEHGRVRFVSLGSGPFRLLARPESQTGKAALLASEVYWPNDSEQILKLRGELELASLRLDVVDADGAAPEAAEARLWRRDSGDGATLDRVSMETEGESETAHFVSASLLPGEYSLEIGASGQGWRSCGSVTLRPGEKLDLGQIRFDPLARVSVLIDDANAREGAEATLWTRQQGALVCSAPTQLSVPCEISLPAGDYEIRCQRHTASAEDAGDEEVFSMVEDGVDFSDSAPQGVALGGFVNEGEPGVPARDELRLAPNGSVELHWKPLPPKR